MADKGPKGADYDVNANPLKGLAMPPPPRQLDIEIEALKIEIALLRDALRPFAKVAHLFDDGVRGSGMPSTGAWYTWPRLVNGEVHDYCLTVEDLRMARDLMGGNDGDF